MPWKTDVTITPVLKVDNDTVNDVFAAQYPDVTIRGIRHETENETLTLTGSVDADDAPAAALLMTQHLSENIRPLLPSPVNVISMKLVREGEADALTT